jgi:hypothetical protein
MDPTVLENASPAKQIGEATAADYGNVLGLPCHVSKTPASETQYRHFTPDSNTYPATLQISHTSSRPCALPNNAYRAILRPHAVRAFKPTHARRETACPYLNMTRREVEI